MTIVDPTVDEDSVSESVVEPVSSNPVASSNGRKSKCMVKTSVSKSSDQLVTSTDATRHSSRVRKPTRRLITEL